MTMIFAALALGFLLLLAFCLLCWVPFIIAIAIMNRRQVRRRSALQLGRGLAS